MKRLRFITKIKIVAGLILVLLVGGAWINWRQNIDWAARVAWGEARGEPDGGMQAVLNVMVNRKKDRRFPKSLSAVARQPYQFSAFNSGNPNREKLEVIDKNDPQFEKALWLATFAQIGLLPDITDGATYYHNDEILPPPFLSQASVSATIGNHIFYK